VQVRARAVAWTDRAGWIEFTTHPGATHRAWVWASAVSRAEAEATWSRGTRARVGVGRSSRQLDNLGKALFFVLQRKADGEESGRPVPDEDPPAVRLSLVIFTPRTGDQPGQKRESNRSESEDVCVIAAKPRVVSLSDRIEVSRFDCFFRPMALVLI
jgi:hypothetical protein